MKQVETSLFSGSLGSRSLCFMMASLPEFSIPATTRHPTRIHGPTSWPTPQRSWLSFSKGCAWTLKVCHQKCENPRASRILTLDWSFKILCPFNGKSLGSVCLYSFGGSFNVSVATEESLQKSCAAFVACLKAFQALVPAAFFSKVENEIVSTFLDSK